MRRVVVSALVLLSLGSCAVMQNPPGPFPVGREEGFFRTTRDGVDIFVHVYEPDDPRGTIYLLSGVTGINHTEERDVVELLAGDAYRVIVIHPRGTGYSAGPRGDVADFSLFLSDYAEIIAGEQRSRDTDDLCILFGHSMSTAMVLAVADRLESVDGVVLVNPPYRLKPAPGMSPSFGAYVTYACYMIFAPHAPIVDMAGNPDLMENREERDEARRRADDPLLVRYISMYTMMESRRLMDTMPSFASTADYPLLLVYGTADSIVDEAGCREIYEAWASSEKRYLRIQGGPHGKQTVHMAGPDITGWLDSL